MPGVIRTRAGWLDGLEVVEVLFDPKVTPYTTLLAQARCVEKPSKAYVYDDKDLAVAKRIVGDEAVRTEALPRDAKVSDQKYYLRQTPFFVLPLTEIQAVRINAILGTKQSKQNPRTLLSPAQRKLLGLIEKNFVAKRNELQSLDPAREPRHFKAYTERLEHLLAK